MSIKSAYENFKDPSQSKPWDILDRNITHVSDKVYNERMAICQECPEYFKPTRQCKECLCIMPIKNKLPDSFCPLHKFDAVTFEILSGDDDV